MREFSKARLFFWVSLLIFAVAFTSSCATTPRRVESSVTTKSDDAIFLRPGGRYVSVSFSDTTGHNFDLRDAVIQKVMSRGYEIVGPQEADYDLRMAVSYLGYLKDNANAPAIGKLLGIAGGAGVGAGLAASGAMRSGAAGLVGLGSMVVLGLAGAAIDNAMTPEMYLADVQVQVRERIEFDPRPIESRTTVITKTGNKTQVRDTRIQTKDDPIESTATTARSGAGHVRTTTRQSVADFETHQTSYKGVVKVLPLEGGGVDENGALNQLADMMANSIAGIFPF
jgi:hypothetical protein